MRLFVNRDHWSTHKVVYQEFFYDARVPTPHASGYWEHGFEFNNDYFLLLVVL